MDGRTRGGDWEAVIFLTNLRIPNRRITSGRERVRSKSRWLWYVSGQYFLSYGSSSFTGSIIFLIQGQVIACSYDSSEPSLHRGQSGEADLSMREYCRLRNYPLVTKRTR